ncbi:tetratricopeptide repeat protein 16 isoform X2 [Hemicordylus capensis]|nr:tetratricopeptide repeat protein 16 isoform X2 [Hemicordylus capensis]
MSSKHQHLMRLACVLHLQGQCLYEQNVYLDALESFTRASELQPSNTLYRMRSIACLAALKRYNDCLQMVSEEVSREKTNPDLFVLRARLYEYFGKAIFTFYNLQEALALDPGHSEARIMMERLKKEAQKNKDRAVSKAVKGNLKGALLKINRAIEYSPENADYFLFRGNLLRRLKDFNAAIDDYLGAVELCKEEEGEALRLEAQKQVLLTYNDFAVHCYSKGFYEEAVLLLNKAIKGEKNEKGLYINRGDCFQKLGQIDFAMADYLQALDLKPSDLGLQKRIACLYNEMGLQDFGRRRYVQAESYFSQAIEHNPRELTYYLHRAKSRMFLQEVMKAKEDVVTAVLLDSKREEVHTLANNLFPGESLHLILNSKIGELAKALLDRRLEAFLPYKALANQERLEVPVVDQPKDVYVQNEEPEKPEGEKQISEEKRLQERLAVCKKKSIKVNEELKEAREKKASLEHSTVQLQARSQLSVKEHTEEPYHWKTFTQGIGHF